MRYAWIFLAVFLIGLSSLDAYGQPQVFSNLNDIYNSPISPSFGNPNGDVTILEYYDYRCSYCKASQEGLERLLQEDGNIRIIYEDFPKLGPLSNSAAVVTLAALWQGADKYLSFHNTLMNKNLSLTSEDILFQVAGSVGLDVNKLKQDMMNPGIVQQIQNNIAIGKSNGVSMTPTFVVGGYIYPGYADYDQLKRLVAYARSMNRGR